MRKEERGHSDDGAKRGRDDAKGGAWPHAPSTTRASAKAERGPSPSPRPTRGRPRGEDHDGDAGGAESSPREEREHREGDALRHEHRTFDDHAREERRSRPAGGEEGAPRGRSGRDEGHDRSPAEVVPERIVAVGLDRQVRRRERHDEQEANAPLATTNRQVPRTRRATAGSTCACRAGRGRPDPQGPRSTRGRGRASRCPPRGAPMHVRARSPRGGRGGRRPS